MRRRPSRVSSEFTAVIVDECGATTGARPPVAMTGALTGEELETANEKWWAYWREYWKRRESSSPLPRDYGCEVTIPAGRHRLGKERNKK